MKIGSMLSSDLPELGPAVKRSVNDGRWFLYRGTAGVPAPLYLEAGRKVYALDESGGVIAEFNMVEVTFITEMLYFSDLPRPPSLSGFDISKYCGRK